MRSAVVVALLLTGCGRWYFDPVADAGGSDVAPPDVPACAHTFCDDFNRATPVIAGWNGNTLIGDPTREIENGQYHVVVNDINDRADLLQGFPAVTSKITVGFSLRYTNATPSMPADQEIDLVRLSWQTLPVGTCTTYGVFLVRDGTGPFNLQETYQGCGANVNTTIRNLVNLPATNVVLSVTFGPPTRIRIALDGVEVIEQAAAHDAAPGALQLGIGADVVRNVVSDWDFRYDDVYVDVE